MRFRIPSTPKWSQMTSVFSKVYFNSPVHAQMRFQWAVHKENGVFPSLHFGKRFPKSVFNSVFVWAIGKNVRHVFFQTTGAWAAGMAQCWERSPPTSVARVRFADPAPYVGWIVGSLLAPRDVFSRYSGFPLSSKINISKFQFSLEPTYTYKLIPESSSVLGG